MNRVRWWLRCLAEISIQLSYMAVIEWSVRRRGLPVTCRRLGITLSMDGAAVGETAALPRRFLVEVRAAKVVATIWPFGDTCLRRCLLLGGRLSVLGPVLRIGVQPQGTGMLAHSWLEIGGRPLDPSAAEFGTLNQVGQEIDDEP